MPIKRILLVLLSVAMLFLSACGNSDVVSQNGTDNSLTQETEKTETLRLLYCAKDTLNPYKTVSKLNYEIGMLIFEPLVKVNNSFEVEHCLADSLEIVEKNCTVTLKKAMFSDGSYLTADDVVFSYNLALKSDSFSYLFYNVESVVAANPSSLVFTLKNYDPYFDRLLTFPILKMGTDELKNEDNVEIPPVGTGRFLQSTESSDLLVPNSLYHGKKAPIAKITLIDAPDSESTEHYVKIGATDIYYTNKETGSAVSMSGNKSSVNLNNLVYIGINNNYGQLQNDILRFALSEGIDRSEIIRTAYHGEAKAASGFFHPDWSETSGYQTIPPTSDSKIVIENLEKIGYNTLDKDGTRKNESGSSLSFDLLVCNESPSQVSLAGTVANQLSSYGIKINIKSFSREQYLSALEGGHFQLYIGEVKLLPNMDISPLVLKGGSAAYGITGAQLPTEENGLNNSDYRLILKGYQEGKNTIADVATSLLASMPIIPVAYRNGLIFYSDAILDIGQSSSYDIFLSLNDYIYN